MNAKKYSFVVVVIYDDGKTSRKYYSGAEKRDAAISKAIQNKHVVKVTLDGLPIYEKDPLE